jgi:chromate transporter
VVVGAMLDLLLFLGHSVLFPPGAGSVRDIDFVAVGWVIASLVLLTRFRMNVVSVILLSICFGVLRNQF